MQANFSLGSKILFHFAGRSAACFSCECHRGYWQRVTLWNGDHNKSTHESQSGVSATRKLPKGLPPPTQSIQATAVRALSWNWHLRLNLFIISLFPFCSLINLPNALPPLINSLSFLKSSTRIHSFLASPQSTFLTIFSTLCLLLPYSIILNLFLLRSIFVFHCPLYYLSF